MRQQEAEPCCGGYNEIILDPASVVEQLPTSIAGFFFLPDADEDEQLNLRAIREHFLEAFALQPSAVPMVVYDAGGSPPFRDATPQVGNGHHRRALRSAELREGLVANLSLQPPGASLALFGDPSVRFLRASELAWDPIGVDQLLRPGEWVRVRELREEGRHRSGGTSEAVLSLRRA